MSRRLTDEELLAKMKTHFQERKALYDALADNLADSYAEAATDPEYMKEQSEWVGSDRVIASSGTESLQTSGSVERTMSERIYCGRCGDESHHGVPQTLEDWENTGPDPLKTYSTELCSECQLIESDDPIALAMTMIKDLRRERDDLRVAHEVVLKQTDIVFARVTSAFALETAGRS